MSAPGAVGTPGTVGAAGPRATLAGLRGRPGAVLAVVSVAAFLAQLDALVVTVAIPQIRVQLGASVSAVVWTVSGYVLALAVGVISGGRLGDQFGHRRVFLAGLGVFTLASLACGLALTPGQLITARVVQGLGAALFTPQTLAMLVRYYPAERRGAAFGVRGAVSGVAAVTAPVLGGLLVGALDWRWVFWLNVPVGVLAMVLGRLAIPDAAPGDAPPGGVRLDLPGVALAASSLLCLSLGLSLGAQDSWDGRIWALLGAGTALGAAFVRQQRGRQQRSPLVPFGLFAVRGFSRMTALGVLVAATITGLVLLLSLYFQSVAGFGALLTGLVLVPASACSMLLNPLAGRLAGKVEGRLLVLGGLGATVLGVLWAVAGMRADAHWPQFVGPMCVIGIGNAFLLTPLVTAAMHHVPRQLSGAASGVFGTALQIGAMVGAALVAPLVQTSPSAHSVRTALVLLAAAACVGGAAFLVARPAPRVLTRTEPLGRG